MTSATEIGYAVGFTKIPRRSQNRDLVVTHPVIMWTFQVKPQMSLSWWQ